MTTVLLEAAAEAPVVAQVAEAVPNAKARMVAGSETPGGARSGPVIVIGPLPCISCGTVVSWWRYDGMYRLREGGTYGPAHRCP